MTARRHTCYHCGTDAREFLPLWSGEEWIERFICDEHYPQEYAATITRRENQFVSGQWRMHGWDLGTFPADDPSGAAAKQAAFEWMEDVDERWFNLYIHGPVGTGKTGLAWSVAYELTVTRLFEVIRFVNVRQLLAQIRRSFNTQEVADPLDELAKAYVIVLDDLGAERVTDWTRDWLATLIESRYVGEQQTIVTSNYSPAQLARRLGHDDPVVGKRIVSRLVENARIIKLDRADLRLRNAA